MKKILLALALLLTPLSANADGFVTQYAPSESNFDSYVAAGYRLEPFSNRKWIRLEGLVGVKNDNVLATRDPILVLDVSPMVYLQFKFFYVRFGTGVAFIHKTDNRLNTRYQFPTTFAVGLADEKVTMGMMFKHYSNGSTSNGNRGWNFKGIEFEYKF